jgi:NADH dehydrogenase
VITVFGGTGFLGSAIVRTLLRQGSSVRVATRHPEREQTSDHPESVMAVQADVRDEASVEAALEGSRAVVNAVGLYVEKGADTFESVHVHGAGNVARLAARVGVERLVHVSGIGASTPSSSSYVRARAGGERIVNESYPDATIVRPSVLFGPGDSFLSAIDGISRLSPVFPLFGSGDTRMQPVFVEDVAEAVARILEDSATRARISELGGPRVYSYREIIEAVLHYRGRRRVLLPIPFGIWTLQARLLALMPDPPLTEDQVVLMRDDNVVGKGVATLDDLGIMPGNLETLLPLCFGQEPGTEDDS